MAGILSGMFPAKPQHRPPNQARHQEKCNAMGADGKDFNGIPWTKQEDVLMASLLFAQLMHKHHQAGQVGRGYVLRIFGDGKNLD